MFRNPKRSAAGNRNDVFDRESTGVEVIRVDELASALGRHGAEICDGSRIVRASEINRADRDVAMPIRDRDRVEIRDERVNSADHVSGDIRRLTIGHENDGVIIRRAQTLIARDRRGERTKRRGVARASRRRDIRVIGIERARYLGGVTEGIRHGSPREVAEIHIVEIGVVGEVTKAVLEIRMRPIGRQETPKGLYSVILGRVGARRGTRIIDHDQDPEIFRRRAGRATRAVRIGLRGDHAKRGRRFPATRAQRGERTDHRQYQEPQRLVNGHIFLSVDRRMA